MKVALYARVSTNDREQDPETQLMALRAYCEARSWTIQGEYVDQAPARDLGARTSWRELLDQAARRRFEVLVVAAYDRAFRSAKHMYEALEVLELAGVAFHSLREQLDTTTPMGRFVRTVLASVAELELEVLSDRTKAGMDRARKQGVKMGRPAVLQDPAVARRLGPYLDRLLARDTGVSVRQVARAVGISHQSVMRLRDLVAAEGPSAIGLDGGESRHGVVLNGASPESDESATE